MSDKTTNWTAEARAYDATLAYLIPPRLCDEPGCDQQATHGWHTEYFPSRGVYRQTCERHKHLENQTDGE